MSRTNKLFRATVILGASMAASMAASGCGDSSCARCSTDGRVADVATDAEKDAGVDALDGGPTDAPVDVVVIL